jgi:RHS repeat-associated protein
MPTTTNYIWDEQNLLAESDGTNTINVVYTNEPQKYGNLISSRISGATSYHAFDALGSTRQLTSSAGGTTDTAIYDAWGNVMNRTGTTAARLLWIGALGYYADAENGQIVVRRRPYAPATARWTALDPADPSVSLNGFAYADARPVTLSDPTGMQAGKPAPSKIRVCCTFDRVCHYCWPFGSHPDTTTRDVSCELPAGIVTPAALAEAANECCSANKPSNNWVNPYIRCGYWTSFGRVGGCAPGSGGKMTCSDELQDFFRKLNSFLNGGAELTDPDDLRLACDVFCQCLFGKKTPMAKSCIGPSFCDPVIAAAEAQLASGSRPIE